MNYSGRIIMVLVYITIVLAWHSFYFLIDSQSSYVLIVEKSFYHWDLLFFSLFLPLFWWLGLQFDKTKYLSENDSLTGLYNRRFVEQITPKMLAQMAKKQKNLTISIIDCNEFKQVNDNLGHKMGDRFLKSVSDILLKSAGSRDIVARWGGDEFILVSPFSNLNKTNEVVERIETELQHLSQDAMIDISVSIGTAVYPDDAKMLTDLLSIADQNMYENKKAQE